MSKGKTFEVSDQWMRVQRENFQEKIFYLQDCGYRSIDIEEYFRLLFDRHGMSYLQEYKNLPAKLIEPDGKYCGLVRYMLKHNESTGEEWQKEHSRSFIVTKEFERARFLIGREKCYTSPLIYIGHKRPGKNARAFFAFVLDIDDVQKKGLEFYFRAVCDGRAPRPSMIVSSGSGVHLYFLLDEPISLNSYSSPMLHYMKICLTTKLWGMLTEIQEPQYHGIFQGYRVPGTRPKQEYGLTDNVMGFVDVDGDIPYYTVTELNKYLLTSKTLSADPPLNRAQLSRLEEMVFDPDRDKTPLEEAKRLWPEWYKKRNKKQDIKASLITIAEQAMNYSEHGRPWNIKPDLYYWWLRNLRLAVDNKVKVGHRFHCVLTLAVFARKCNISFSQLKTDAYSLLEYMDSLTTDPKNHFKKKDIKDALEAYRESSRLYRRWTLEKLTAIPMPENKRNFRKQKIHLKIARNTQAILHEADGTDWRSGNGRRPQWELVKEWRENNPDNSNKSQCARECELARTTVIKWWDCTSEQEAQLISEKARAVVASRKKDLTSGYGKIPEVQLAELQDSSNISHTVGASSNAPYVKNKGIMGNVMGYVPGADKLSQDDIQELKYDLADELDFSYFENMYKKFVLRLPDTLLSVVSVKPEVIEQFRDEMIADIQQNPDFSEDMKELEQYMKDNPEIQRFINFQEKQK